MKQRVVNQSAAGSTRRMALALSICAVLFGFLATCAPAHAQDFRGNWKNQNPNTTEIVQIQISVDPNTGGLVLRAFAGGQPPIDLGPVPLSPDGNKASASYDFGFSVTTFVLELINGNTLNVREFTAFFDGSGRLPRDVTETFIRG